MGYFSLTGKSLEVEKLLKFPASPALGKMSKTPSKNMNNVETYLIGHLSKNYYRNYNEEISGHDIFIRSYEYIRQVNKLLGINIIRVDCGSDLRLIQFYKNEKFRILGLVPRKQRNSNHPSENMIVMVRNIYS
ncbi:hypothetical protein MmiAt1_04050 [Methanimicrococcus sp. At1]|uniref:Uncharacterized protein n=1 Tax=Methanimicrococcus hacksteinii TaxID=3028293 RepID=A0ABU3VNT7_9EURY|nr:hypothetical protein [Methanimicrococcus sp. At1]